MRSWLNESNVKITSQLHPLHIARQFKDRDIKNLLTRYINFKDKLSNGKPGIYVDSQNGLAMALFDQIIHSDIVVFKTPNGKEEVYKFPHSGDAFKAIFDFDRNGKLNISKAEKLGQVDESYNDFEIQEAYERGFQNGFQMSLQENLTHISEIIPNLLLKHFQEFLKKRIKYADASITRDILTVKADKHNFVTVEVGQNGKNYVFELRYSKDGYLEDEFDTADLNKAFSWIKENLF